MNKISFRTNYSLIAIIGLLIFTATIFFIRTYIHEPSGDELLYQYAWEKDDPTNLWNNNHRFERKVSSINDIITTQILHYQFANGRSIVHSVEQAFTEHDLMFGILNSIVFIIFVSLIVIYVTPSPSLRHKYILWLAILICLLFLFPYQSSLWTSVNYGLNYLWPATMSTAFLLIWNRILRKPIKQAWNIPIAILAFILGWTHEGFAVAIAGGTFIFYCFNFRKFRGQALILCIPFWLSTCIMVFAPANFNRFLPKGGPSIFMKIANGIDNTFHLWMFWILIIGTLISVLAGKREKIAGYCRKNLPLLLVFCTAFVFSLIVNTKPYSHTMVELTSLLLIFKYICTETNFSTKTFTAASLILSVLFVIQQTILMFDTIKVYQKQHSIIESYRNTDNHVFTPYTDISLTSAPYIRLWDKNERLFFEQVFTNVYGYNRNKKDLILLNPEDINAIINPEEFFTPERRFPGNAPAYKDSNGEYIWLHPDSLPISGNLQAELYPVDRHHNAPLLLKLKFMLFTSSYSNTETLSADTLDTNYGMAYRIRIPLIRKISSINVQ